MESGVRRQEIGSLSPTPDSTRIFTDETAYPGYNPNWAGASTGNDVKLPIIAGKNGYVAMVSGIGSP
ncbi:MAG TPA: hypothetical protein VKA68_13055, partial [bacterium]|nr:hypothetical protein [bacterium]